MTPQGSLPQGVWEPRYAEADAGHHNWLSRVWRLEQAAWCALIPALAIGYLTLGKGFAYFGVPQLKVFVGEVFLAAFLLTWPSGIIGTWFAGLLGPHPLTRFTWTHLLFAVYGIWEVFRGVEKGYPLVVAAQNLVFNLYPVYVFVGYWAARHSPDLLARTTRVVAATNAVYGLAFIAYLNRISVPIPGTQASFLAQPVGSVTALLALIAFGGRGAVTVILLVLNAFVILGTQVRADWLGFLVGLLVWGACTRNLGKVGQILGLVAVMLGLGLAADIQLPGVAGRASTTSAREIVGRAVAGIDIDMARQFTNDAEAYAGTLSWRTNWWREIWATVHVETNLTLFGHGYGYPLSGLVPYMRNEMVTTRTPHNIFYYALGYTGWTGVLLFVAFQSALGFLQWEVFRRTGQSFGLALWSATVSAALWGNLLESPFGAIPFYILMGMSAATLVNSIEETSPVEDEDEDEGGPDSLPASE